MSRANRYLIPGQVWHITHRCHQREFLLADAHDRQRWLHWLLEATARYGLCVLDYIVTSNHVHLLVRDRGDDAISRSLQLVAGRLAQEFNRRMGRRGAFWEDRYHATAVAADAHLLRCLVYIDLNMVRARAVEHPSQWRESGYNEIQGTVEGAVDLGTLAMLLGFDDLGRLRHHHRLWVEDAVACNATQRDECWTESLAVGSQAFVEDMQRRLGWKARRRSTATQRGLYVLREAARGYRNQALRKPRP